MDSSKNQIKICRTTLNILKFSLIWPSEKDEMHPDKWYYIRVASFLLITSWLVLCVVMHLVISIKHNVNVNLIEDVGLLVAFTGLYYMTVIYVKNQPRVALLLRDLSNFEKFGQPPGFKEEENKMSLLSKVLFYYTVVGIFIYNLIKLLEKPECEKVNREKGLQENCGLLGPTWFPFDINYFPVFHLVLLYIFISTQILMKLALMISFNALEIAHQIILRINRLNAMLVTCFDDKDYETNKRKLKNCILYHIDILNSLSSRLDDCFSNGMFAHLTITAAICGCLLKLLVEDSNKIGVCIHIFGWIMALFVACLGGQHLINAGNTIPEAIWSSKWFEADFRLRKDLLFVLSKSQKGLHMRAGSFGVMSFALFVSVLKMSYSILAMLTS